MVEWLLRVAWHVSARATRPAEERRRREEPQDEPHMVVLRNLRSYSARCRVSPLLRCVRVAVEEGWGGGGTSIRV